MNQIYSTLSSRLLILVLFFLPCLSTYAQNKNAEALHNTALRDTALRESVREQARFITHAPVLVPALLNRKAYDSIAYFLTNWENEDFANPELIFSLRMLLAIETRQASSQPLPCDVLIYLTDYARELKDLQNKGDQFKYYLKVGGKYYYDATVEVSRLLYFTQHWALRLERQGPRDATERFFCRVFSGEIEDPKRVLREDPNSCPPIARMQAALKVHNDSIFRDRRDRTIGTSAFVLGAWFPTSHLQVLGSHPSFGFIFGVRNKWNEYDAAMSFRFVSAPHIYTYLHNDSLQTSAYYDGGTMGFDYTRYLLHRKYFEVGVVAGLAYDFFDGPEDSDQNTVFTIGSFNFNSGIRMKYFLRRHGFIGLTAKYHMIHYSNDGGTNLDGNAWSVELSFGSH